MRALLLVLLGACGRLGFDTGVAALPDGGARDGARLRIVWNTFEDGTRTAGGIYDTERGEPCEVRAWGDGALYCTPTQRTEALFADAACTDAVVPMMGCGDDRYAFTDELCTHRITHLYARGAEVGVPTYYRIDRTSVTCVAQPAGPTLFATTEVAPSELARIEVAGGAVRAYVAEDGFALPFALHHDALGDCQPVAAGDGYTCLPAASEDPVYGLDGACTQRVVGATQSCPPPDFVAYPGADCRTHVATVTSTIGGIGGWALPLCTDAENGPLAAWYLVGPEVEGPAIERRIDPIAPGRRLATISFGPGLRDSALYDSVLGIECTPGVDASGVARCLPAHTATIRTWATDPAQCLGGTTVDAAIVSLGCAEPVPDVAVRSVSVGACEPQRSELSEVGAPTTVYGAFHGSCPGLPAYEVGAAIDPSIYAAYETEMDP